VDKIAGNPYVLPNNLALIRVSDIMPRTEHEEIAPDFAQVEAIWTVGIPKRPEEIEHCAPFLKDDSKCGNKVRQPSSI
jgi:hypothetical protein